MILQNIETGEVRYFFPFHNTHVFLLPEMVRNTADLDRVLNKIENLELVESILQDRPNSKWKLVEITNIKYVVTLTNFALGCDDVIIPDF